MAVQFVTLLNGVRIAYKYAHTFAVSESHCDKCNADTFHSFALLSRSKTSSGLFWRIKICNDCNSASESKEPLGVKKEAN